MSQQKVYTHSALHSVLSEYGLPTAEKVPKTMPLEQHPLREKHCQEKKKNDKLQREKTWGSAVSDDRDKERQRARQERHLQVYEDVHRLRDYCYDQYMDQLRQKVEKQREDIKKKTSEMESKLKALDDRDKQGRRRRLERHDLEHNEAYVAQIPKSNYYKIVALEDRLKAEGRLKTQEDKDSFWREMQKNNSVQQYLMSYKPLTDVPTEISVDRSPTTILPPDAYSESQPPRSRSSSIENPAPLTEDFRPMTRIRESRESSRPVTRDLSAALGQPTGDSQSSATAKHLEPNLRAKMAAMEMERKYPQLEFPQLYCFGDDLDEKPPDPEKILDELSRERRNKERKLFVKRLRRMHKLSHSNAVSTQRIIDRHGFDEAQALENPSLRDLLAIATLSEEPASPSNEDAVPQRPWERHLRHRAIQPIAEESQSATDSRVSSATPKPVSSGSRNKSVEMASRKDPPQALALREVVDKNTTKESQCLSTYWNNYLKVGKSKFVMT